MKPPRKIDGAQSNEETHKSKMFILESMSSIIVYDFLLGQHETYGSPDNVNTPNVLNPSMLATALSNMIATTATKSSDDTTNFTTSTSITNSSSTSFFSLTSENKIDASTFITTNKPTTSAPIFNPTE